MKYVWGAVAVCMFFIVIIWIISIKAMFHQSTAGQDFDKLRDSFGNPNVDMPSISDLSQQEGTIKSSLEQGSAPSNKPIDTTTTTQQNQTQQ